MNAEDVIASMKPLATLKPDTQNAFDAFSTATMAEGELSTKTKELIAIAVALTTQCQYCLAVHTKLAKKEGATDAELAEVTFVAALLRGGAAIAYGANHVIGS